ncbi:insulin-like growth factor-binding protein 4 [Ascaphus truei]|uniref:insulin-like growth factor-binding protein 4 n=1 Tax=Ascaphus truei TaxID=8439 RepID=UPI003F5948AD
MAADKKPLFLPAPNLHQILSNTVKVVAFRICCPLTTEPSVKDLTLCGNALIFCNSRRFYVGHYLQHPFLQTSTAFCICNPTFNDEHPNTSFSPCGLQDRKCLQRQHAKLHRSQGQSATKLVKNGNGAAPVPDVRMGSCHGELNRALERLSASHSRTQEDFLSIPIPNCDRSGNFHPKQCHPALDGQRGKCWCVDRKSGTRLHVPYDPSADPDCQMTSEGVRD